ncbi:hypothetical protein, partial [Pseudomonas viridiflava]|uniref:hypothetical protein n=1 Tax=Pseudomonas viridiflava TaxID=33069 RepID=UPI00197D8736
MLDRILHALAMLAINVLFFGMRGAEHFNLQSITPFRYSLKTTTVRPAAHGSGMTRKASMLATLGVI